MLAAIAKAVVRALRGEMHAFALDTRTREEG
jgi:stress-induced morphogen